jgi:hypothetical protein
LPLLMGSVPTRERPEGSWERPAQLISIDTAPSCGGPMRNLHI